MSRQKLETAVALAGVVVWVLAPLLVAGCPASNQPAATSSIPPPAMMDAAPTPDACAHGCAKGRELGCSDITDQCEGTCRALATAPIISFDAACLAGATSKSDARSCAGVTCP